MIFQYMYSMKLKIQYELKIWRMVDEVNFKKRVSGGFRKKRVSWRPQISLHNFAIDARATQEGSRIGCN